MERLVSLPQAAFETTALTRSLTLQLRKLMPTKGLGSLETGRCGTNLGQQSFGDNLMDNKALQPSALWEMEAGSGSLNPRRPQVQKEGASEPETGWLLAAL